MDAALVLGATMRLTRLVTSDDLGQWWVKDPLDAWMHGHPVEAECVCENTGTGAVRFEAQCPVHGLDISTLPNRHRLRYHRYLAGLECPHCVGFWVGALVLGSYVATGRSRRARAAWRFVAGTLSLNTVSVALGKQIDYWS